MSGSGVRLWVTRRLEGASGSCESVTLISDILNRIECARIDYNSLTLLEKAEIEYGSKSGNWSASVLSFWIVPTATEHGSL